MGNETHILVAVVTGIYRFVVWLYTAPNTEVDPFINRVLYYFFLVLVMYWLWKWATRKIGKK